MALVVLVLPVLSVGGGIDGGGGGDGDDGI